MDAGHYALTPLPLYVSEEHFHAPLCTSHTFHTKPLKSPELAYTFLKIWYTKLGLHLSSRRESSMCSAGIFMKNEQHQKTLN